MLQKSELVEGTKTREVYGSADIIERHRHRYEMNNRFIPALEEAGMKISGYSPVQHLVETVELPATSLVLLLYDSTRNLQVHHVMDTHYLLVFIDAAKAPVQKKRSNLGLSNRN